MQAQKMMAVKIQVRVSACVCLLSNERTCCLCCCFAVVVVVDPHVWCVASLSSAILYHCSSRSFYLLLLSPLIVIRPILLLRASGDKRPLATPAQLALLAAFRLTFIAWPRVFNYTFGARSPPSRHSPLAPTARLRSKLTSSGRSNGSLWRPRSPTAESLTGVCARAPDPQPNHNGQWDFRLLIE